jgi:AcrR family transcriptional regulator
MARTQAIDYEQRREAIVEKAAELYADKGFAGASVSELADALGASKSLIYHYYPSKEDILFDVMDSHLMALNDAVNLVASRDIPPADRLRELTRAMMRLYVGAAARHKVLLNELDSLPPDRRANIVLRQEQLIRIVEKLLVEIQPSLKKKKRAQTPAAMLFFGMINWTHTWFRADGGASAMEVADMAAEITLHGLQGVR